MMELLAHFAHPKTNKQGKEFNAPINAEGCLGEFLPFKRMVSQNLGEKKAAGATKENFCFFTPVELMHKLFGVHDNRVIFPGNVHSLLYSVHGFDLCTYMFK